MEKTICFVCAIFLILCVLPHGQKANAIQEKRADYSNTPRNDVPEEYTWRIEDLFETKEAWDREKERIFSAIDKINELASGWTSPIQKSHSRQAKRSS